MPQRPDAAAPSLAWLGSIALTFLAGCVTPVDKSAQLERVAKDWCLTIRASQVMPVYPLTQDLRPGDVFLTTTPIGEEVKLFESKGFLPLDFHLVRLDTAPVLQSFYATQLGEGPQFPNPVATWQSLPGSAFPSYTFEISRAGGLNLAIPVQGVPIGFNFLRSAAASGTVTLRQSDTAGLDIASLQPLLETWAKAHRELLASYVPPAGTYGSNSPNVYVRIVSRVYRDRARAAHQCRCRRPGRDLLQRRDSRHSDCRRCRPAGVRCDLGLNPRAMQHTVDAARFARRGCVEYPSQSIASVTPSLA